MSRGGSAKPEFETVEVDLGAVAGGGQPAGAGVASSNVASFLPVMAAERPHAMAITAPNVPRGGIGMGMK